MAEENTEGETFQASPELAERMLRALAEVEGDEVSGFEFGKLMPSLKMDGPPLRPKDGGDFGPIETGWTTWRKVG